MRGHSIINVKCGNVHKWISWITINTLCMYRSILFLCFLSGELDKLLNRYIILFWYETSFVWYYTASTNVCWLTSLALLWIVLVFSLWAIFLFTSINACSMASSAFLSPRLKNIDKLTQQRVKWRVHKKTMCDRLWIWSTVGIMNRLLKLCCFVF